MSYYIRMSLESYYRSFLHRPYANGSLYGGKINRFGSQLSGNPPRGNIFRGYPHGGAEGAQLNPKFFDAYKIGGGYRQKKARKYRGRGPLMDNYINPRTTYHTYPIIGSMIY